jgi:hypothetical protein
MTTKTAPEPKSLRDMTEAEFNAAHHIADASKMVAAPEPVAPVLIALAWSKARNAWMTASRHGTQKAADLLAIAELTHYLAPPADKQVARLEGLAKELRGLVMLHLGGQKMTGARSSLDAHMEDCCERIRAALKEK